jgi:NADPH oxidase 2
MNNFHFSKPTRLSKVYFTWVVRDYESTEWFHSLLHAIEEQDSFNKIEINIYLTGPVKVDDIDNIMARRSPLDALIHPELSTGSGRRSGERCDHILERCAFSLLMTDTLSKSLSAHSVRSS